MSVTGVLGGTTVLASSPAAAGPLAVPTAPVGSFPDGVAVDATTNTIYVANFGLNSVSVIDGATCDAATQSGCTPVASAPVGTTPDGVAVDAATNTIYVANNGSNTVSVIDGATCDAATQSGCTPVASPTVGTNPAGVAVDAATSTIYVANRGSGTVSVIDGATCDASSQSGCSSTPPTVTVGASPIYLDIFPATATTPDTVYVANNGSNTVSIFGQPDAPGTPTAATSGAGSVTVSWSPPASDGQLLLSNYSVVPSPPCASCSGLSTAGTTTTVSGLVAGTTYSFTVVAANAAGPSPASAPSNAVTAVTFASPPLPAGVPGAPAGLKAIPGNTQVSLSWTAPLYDGGSAITGYDVYEGTASGGESTTPLNPSPLSASATSYTVSGLTDGITYFFTVKAINSVGTSPASNEATATPVSSPTGGAYVPVTPARIADTRTGSGLPNAGQTIAPNRTLEVQVTGAGGVPATGACAAVLKVTDAGSTAAGFLTVFPTGATQPLASNVNFAANQIVSNQVTVPLGTGGQVSIYNHTGNTNVAVDVDGYYTCTASTSSTGLFNAVSPVRVFGTLASGAAIAANTSAPVTVTGGTTGVPTTASAVVVNLTAASGTAPSFLSAYPAGGTLPLVSNLNFTAGEVAANRATIGVGNGGQIEIYNHTGSVKVDVDVDGYYTGTPGAPGSAFFPITPVRLTDTRTPFNGTPIAANTTEKFSLANASIPSSAAAVQTNVTVVPGRTAGFLSVYPTSDTTVPVASDVNWLGTTLPPAQASGIPNSTIADTAGTGSVEIYNGPAVGGSAVNIVIDASGYFGAPGPAAPPT
ncbi:MAG: fibronectin type III domain-containing protein [Acidimicrobiales bacterium]